jgi:hypothetical protein
MVDAQLHDRMAGAERDAAHRVFGHQFQVAAGLGACREGEAGKTKAGAGKRAAGDR